METIGGSYVWSVLYSNHAAVLHLLRDITYMPANKLEQSLSSDRTAEYDGFLSSLVEQ